VITSKQRAPSTSEATDATPARSLKGRYGDRIVSRGIATFPSLILRWQAALGLEDGHVVMLAHILSYYREAGKWPSVSIQRMAKQRGRSWEWIERQVDELETLRYLTRPGRDRTYGSWVFDLSPLLMKLDEVAQIDSRIAGRRVAEAEARATLLRDLSTTGETNREPDREQTQTTTGSDEQQTTTEGAKTSLTG
jgi:hypothetical protein